MALEILMVFPKDLELQFVFKFNCKRVTLCVINFKDGQKWAGALKLVTYQEGVEFIYLLSLFLADPVILVGESGWYRQDLQHSVDECILH